MKRKTMISHIVLTCLSAAVIISGCAGGGQAQPQSSAATSAAAVSTASSEAASSPASNPDAGTVKKPDAGSAVLGESTGGIVLVDENDIKITATGFGKYEEDFYSADRALLMEVRNNSGNNVSVSLKRSSVNDYMIDTVLSVNVAAGETRTVPGVFNEFSMDLAGITTIAEMEFVVEVTDADTNDTVIESEPITLRTAEWDTFLASFDESGVVAYEDSQIKIVYQEVFDSDVTFGPQIKVYVSNESDRFISVNASSGKVNGKTMDIYGGADVLPGKHAVFILGPDSQHMVDKISSYEGSFAVRDNDSGDTLIENTGTVTVNY